MLHTTLIGAPLLAAHLNRSNWVVVDCRFELSDTEAGRRAYAVSRIPGARYAHLDEDLSNAVIPGKTGRHPLPDAQKLAARLGQWGIDASTQVVAYDAQSGATAARLWWLLRWLGHEAVAVLDGGWDAWSAGGYSIESGPAATPLPRVFTPRLRPELAADAAAVEALRQDPAFALVDVRAPERYRGEVEPIDPVAGHIEGAINLPFADNLQQGRFRPAEALREHYEQATAHKPAQRVVFYCGSGVTACHGILAYAHAGLGDALLYPGSWSEWIAVNEMQ